MAEPNYVSGLGARRAPSAVGLSYLKTVKEAGEKLAGTAMGYTEAQVEISRREAEARSKIKESNVGTQGGSMARFLQTEANKMKNRIGGELEDSYDFSNVNDISRFATDLEKLDARINEAETEHAARMGTREDSIDANTFNGLMKRTQLATASGGPTEGHVYENLAGEGDFYDAKSADYQSAYRASQMFDDLDINENADGTFTVIVPGEESPRDFASFSDVLDYQREAVQPSYERMPEISGGDYVEDKNIGPNKFQSASQAASAYFDKVTTPALKAAALRRSQTLTGTREKMATFLSAESREELIQQYGFEAPENFTEEQYSYFKEMMQRWKDLKKAEVKKDPSGRSGDKSADILSTSPSIRSFTTFSDQSVDAQGMPAGAENMGGSATISMGKDLPIKLEMEDAKTGILQPVRSVKVRTIGYDAFGPFGIGVFKDLDGNERSVRVPLPAAPDAEAPGGLLDEIKQEFDMTPAEYKQLMRKLRSTWDKNYGAGRGD